MKISFKTKGDWSKTEKFLNTITAGRHLDSILERYGKEGVEALEAATPRDTGLTASSWRYTIDKQPGRASLVWSNDNTNSGVNIAILIQYGHGTRNGGYVEGRDYINPAIQPIFDKIADKAWKEVTGL